MHIVERMDDSPRVRHKHNRRQPAHRIQRKAAHGPINVANPLCEWTGELRECRRSQ